MKVSDPDDEQPTLKPSLGITRKILRPISTKQSPPVKQPEDPEEEEAADDPEEDKAAKFKRIAGRRMKSVLTQLRLLGNCARKVEYEYSSENAEKLIGKLRQAVDELESKFSPALDDEIEFKFE
jgi:hypothetical protein